MESHLRVSRQIADGQEHDVAHCLIFRFGCYVIDQPAIRFPGNNEGIIIQREVGEVILSAKSIQDLLADEGTLNHSLTRGGGDYHDALCMDRRVPLGQGTDCFCDYLRRCANDEHKDVLEPSLRHKSIVKETVRACKQEINGNRPFIIFYAWDSGGGHFIVGRGYKSDTKDYLYLMNPLPGEGYGTFTYAYVKRKVGHHTWTHTLRNVKKDATAGDWDVTNTAPSYSGGYWNYVLSLKEISNGCGKLVKFYHDFYDGDNKWFYRQDNVAADFPPWLDECADKDIEFPRKTKFCGTTSTSLGGGRTSGYIKHSFVIKLDSGTTITRSKKIALTGGGGVSSLSIQRWEMPATGPRGDVYSPTAE